MGRLQAAVTTGLWALRAYAASTALIAVAGALALAAALPVISLVASGPAGAPRLSLPPVRDGELGIVWSTLAASASDLQARAVATVSTLLFAIAVAALAITGLTVFTLAAARSAARRQEMAVRRAVGASRKHLLAAGLVEGSVLAGLALVVGFPVALAGSRLAIAAWPGFVAAGSAAPIVATVLGAIAAIAVGALFPMFPASRTRVAPQGTMPHGLAVPAAQLGFSLMVLIAAGQLARHGGSLIGDRGPVPSHAGAGEILEIRVAGSAPAERAARYAGLLARLEGRFEAVSLTSPGAHSGQGSVDFVVTECGQCAQGGIMTTEKVVPATVAVVSRDTFRAMGLRVLEGRGIGDADRWDAPRVAVVSQSLAAWYFQGGRAVGRKVLVGRGPDDTWHTVVGIVDDRKAVGLGGALQPKYVVYLSALQRPPGAIDLLVRPRAGGESVAGAVAAVRESRGVAGPIARVSEADRLAAAQSAISWLGRLLRLEGGVTLLIAVLGTFAAIHLWVTALIPELAVRRAVGARRRRIVGFVLARVAGVAVGGVAVGLWLGEFVSGGLANLVAGLPGRDLSVVAGPALVLVAATFLGAFAPMWRAARADPARLAVGEG